MTAPTQQEALALIECSGITKGDDETWYGSDKEFHTLVAAAYARGVADEREACAKVCTERHANGNYKYDTREECENAIRNRSRP